MIAQAHASYQIQRAFVPLMAPGDAVPDAALSDQFGKPLSLRGVKPSIVSFAYTRCPDPRTCALVTAKFSHMQRTLAGTGIRLIEVTLDPNVDRPAVLERYATAVGARPGRWEFATGEPAGVVALSERFGVLRERGPSGNLEHTDVVAIVSGTGILRDLIDGTTWSPDDVAAEARREAGLGSNPVSRLALALFASASALCGGRGGGIPLIGALATFVLLAAFLSILAVRSVAADLFDWS
jgi:protein SCO1/2